ncbi:hypothetical protein I317_03047 [Kwoniella heveanensis CBS 569]|uniref:Extracellular membrane protein CFEM domain-containing protein n=1 Tax=Kwoniella heveanensis BCC8398 TaxID=1296120 RepID=A0A1B9GII3_9TREE|nr:hypothetical protein I316_07526 [Kwoniella heveanensis BCC8398]OCF43078.1 hypothetical protein I317_03047 [Kwoniella heveanensis CBS 569]
MLYNRLFSLLPLLPLVFSAPLPLPLLGLDDLAATDGILDPLLNTQDFAVPPPSSSDPSGPALGPGGLLSGLLGNDNDQSEGLLGSLVDTVTDITGPLNISLGLNTSILGTDLDLGLNIQLGDDEELICGSVNGVWDGTSYDLRCVCWSVEKGIVIDAQVGADIGLGEREGLDAFLRAQIQFGGHKFAYPAYAEPTCDGSGGFNCPGGRQANGKCSAFLAAKPRPRPIPAADAGSPAPTPTPAPAAAAIPPATDLQINSVPPTTISASATTTTAAAAATVNSPDAPQAQAQDETFGIQAVPAVAAAVTQFGTTTTTSMSTETIVLPATVFVEMITTTEMSTIYATVTQTEVSTSISTATVTSTQTSTQTQWTTATSTVSTCSTTAEDEQINVDSVAQPTTSVTGYTPASSTLVTSTSSSSATPAPEVTIAATPAPATGPATSGSTGGVPAPDPTSTPTPAVDNGDGDDDDTFSGPRVIDLAKPQSHGSTTCPEGQAWGSTMCCRTDQVEVDGECKCHDGFENIVDVCLRLCIGDRLPSGECSILGLGLDLGVGLGGLEL